jgi:putative tryptophan/tyrosine transport system substrate-binding protein
MIARRAFITLLGGAAAAWPVSARAQQPKTQRRIAIFHPAIPVALLTETGGGSAWRAFFGELRRLGYIEGENLIIERYSAEGHHERYTDIAQDIVSRRPDVIVTGTNPVVTAFKAATSTIPVVAFMLDPLHAGLVTSLSRPGGNLTGITLDAGVDVWGKRLQILKEAIPSTAKAAFLGMRGARRSIQLAGPSAVRERSCRRKSVPQGRESRATCPLWQTGLPCWLFSG